MRTPLLPFLGNQSALACPPPHQRGLGFTQKQIDLKQQRIHPLVRLTCDEVAVFALVPSPGLSQDVAFKQSDDVLVCPRKTNKTLSLVEDMNDANKESRW